MMNKNRFWKGVESWVENEKSIWILLGCILVFRIFYLAVVPFDLIHDEAYYWDWSRNLDICYYSKPPGIAWIIASATAIGGSTPFFVRLPAAVLSTLPILFAYLLGRRIYDQRTGIAAALLMAATPGNVASGVMMTIDAPFLCCWSMALYCFWRMLERSTDRILWTVMTGLAVGAGLLCKQTMIAFPLLAGSFAVLSAADRNEWRRLSFWGCAVLAAAFLLPSLWWNSQHGWITLEHTGSHFSGQSDSVLRRLAVSAEFFASQVGLISPSTYFLILGCGILGVRHFRKLDRRALFLLWFWGGPMLGVFVLSLRQRVEPNWPAPFYASAIVLLAAVALDRIRTLSLPAWSLRTALGVGVLSISLTYLLPFAIIGLNLKASPIDVAVRMWGWRELAQSIDEKLEAADARDLPIMVTADRGVTAELGFYLPSQPDVRLWNPRQHVTSQYDIWGMHKLAVGDDLVVVGKESELPASIARAFEEIRATDSVNVKISQDRALNFRIWVASGFQGWPADPSPQDPSLRVSQRGGSNLRHQAELSLR